MKYATLIALTAAISLARLPGSTSAAVVEYRILINGVDANQHALSAGTHTLEIQGRVTDNELAPGVPGGFLAATFDLLKDNNGVVFVPEPGSGDDAVWNSVANEAFDAHSAGLLLNGHVIQESGSIRSSDWNTRFGEVGAEVWSFIASGQFQYNGNLSTVVELSSIPGVNLVASLNGANVGGRIPNSPEDAVYGDSVRVGIFEPPEPSALLLTCMALPHMLTWRIRSC